MAEPLSCDDLPLSDNELVRLADELFVEIDRREGADSERQEN